ncbi:hypothetical protein BHE74_00013543 [Ensete ventricosum]|nr:hypothetical protein GW17_00041382 [Ensete ventricosum]RWW78242.1 hypothetical protein BHE74_00013543 [Ensete ventricosum]
MERNGSASTSTSSLFLDRVGEVAVTLDPDGLSWKPIDFVSPLSIINLVLYRKCTVLWCMDSIGVKHMGLLGRSVNTPSVFVHPLCGKGNGVKTWETVAPIFSHSKVRTEVRKCCYKVMHFVQVTVTQRAGHAFDCIASLSHRELSSFDGIVAVVCF